MATATLTIRVIDMVNSHKTKDRSVPVETSTDLFRLPYCTKDMKCAKTMC